MKQIRLSKGLFALVSDEDYDYLMQWKWCASHESRGTKWYAVRWEKRGTVNPKVRMHRAIVQRLIDIGHCLVPLDGNVVDHINHNSLDNQRHNLRIVTQRENMLASPGWKRSKNCEHGKHRLYEYCGECNPEKAPNPFQAEVVTYSDFQKGKR